MTTLIIYYSQGGTTDLVARTLAKKLGAYLLRIQDLKNREGFANRLQIQERLNQQIANAIQETLNPEGVIVVIEAEHTCMTLRGIKNKGAITTTVATRGIYNQLENRNEILSLIN